MSASAIAAGKTVPSPEDVGRQIEALRADLMKLTTTLSDDLVGGVTEAGRQIGRTGAGARRSATNAVLEHPLAAVGVAVCAGVLLGLFARKA